MKTATSSARNAPAVGPAIGQMLGHRGIERRAVPVGEMNRTGDRPQGGGSEASRFASQHAAQLARGTEQMDPHRRFVQPRHRADFPGRAVSVVTQHEDRSLPAVEAFDRGGNARPTLAREQSVPRVVDRSGPDSDTRASSTALTSPATNHRSRCARDLRRSRHPLVRIRVNHTSKGHASRYEAIMREDLDEGVLYGLVRLRRIPQGYW